LCNFSFILLYHVVLNSSFILNVSLKGLYNMLWTTKNVYIHVKKRRFHLFLFFLTKLTANLTLVLKYNFGGCIILYYFLSKNLVFNNIWWVTEIFVACVVSIFYKYIWSWIQVHTDCVCEVLFIYVLSTVCINYSLVSLSSNNY
jgi:hypothetical protein